MFDIKFFNAQKNIQPHLQSASLPLYPTLPPLMLWQIFSISYIIGLIAIELPIHSGTFCIILFLLDKRLWKPFHFFVFTICFILGTTVSLFTKQESPQYTPIWLAPCFEYRKPVHITGTIQKIQSKSGNYLQVILDNVHPTNTSSMHPPPSELPTKLLFTVRPSKIHTHKMLPGQKLTAMLVVSPIQGFRNTGGHHISAYWHRQNIYFRGWLKNIHTPIVISGKPKKHALIRSFIYKKVIQNLSSKNSPTENKHAPSMSIGKAFIPALIFNDKFFLTHDVNTYICYSGLAHSLALSGQHLAIVSLLSGGFIILFIQFFRHFFLLIPKYKAIPLISILFACLYLWLGNAPPSLIRASIMLFVWGIVTMFNKRIPFIDTVFIALLCILTFDSQYIHHIGIQLSFIAVIFLALIPSYVYQYGLSQKSISLQNTTSTIYKKLTLQLKQSLFVIFTVTTTAQLATLPLCLNAFGYTSWLVMLNILWVPIISIVILPLSFLGLFLSILQVPTIPSWAFTLASLPCEGLINLIKIIDKKISIEPLWLPRPHWLTTCGYYLLLLSLFVCLNQRTISSTIKRMFFIGLSLVIIGISFAFLPQNTHKLRLKILDVGQGQSILIEWGNKKRALIDTGGINSKSLDIGKDVVAPILANNNPLHLTFVAISHPDTDHAKGLLFLAQHFHIEQIFSTCWPAIDTKHGRLNSLALKLETLFNHKKIPRKILSRGDIIPLDHKLYLEVLSPQKDSIPKRNTSLILRLVYQDYGLAFLPGDAEKKDLYELIKTGYTLQSEVLVLPHHGSKTSLVPKLYEMIQPQVAVASTGLLNKHRLPSPYVHAALLEQNIPLRTTAEEGEIIFEWDLNELRQH